MKTKHTLFIEDFLVAAGRRPMLGRFWKRNTGRARMMKKPEKIISYGFKGSADIEGLLNDGHGKHVEIEIKIGKDDQRPRQINFEAMIKQYNGVYILVRVVDWANKDQIIAETLSALGDMCKQ